MNGMNVSPVDAVYFDFQGIFLDKVPCIPTQLSLDAFGNVCRSVYSQRGFPSQQCAEQRVEPDEMIDVRMGYKHIGDLLEFARTELVYIADVKEQGPFFMCDSQEKRGVLKGAVDKTMDERWFHGVIIYYCDIIIANLKSMTYIHEKGA